MSATPEEFLLGEPGYPPGECPRKSPQVERGDVVGPNRTASTLA